MEAPEFRPKVHFWTEFGCFHEFLVSRLRDVAGIELLLYTGVSVTGSIPTPSGQDPHILMCACYFVTDSNVSHLDRELNPGRGQC